MDTEKKENEKNHTQGERERQSEKEIVHVRRNDKHLTATRDINLTIYILEGRDGDSTKQRNEERERDTHTQIL